MTASITIAGKEYISAVRASKKIGYSTDYIGQLCRAKKIPSSLIGKTWYVDYDALNKYKKNRKKRVPSELNFSLVPESSLVKRLEKKEESLEPVKPARGNLLEVEKLKILNNVVITYEKEDQPRLPELSKNSERSLNKKVVLKPKKVRPQMYLAPLALSLMLLFGVSITKLENVSLSPLYSLYDSVSSSLTISTQPALLASITSWFEKFFKMSGEDNHLVERTSDDISVPSSGLVVVPATDDRAGVVSRIKNAFSDDVEVSFDQSGDTGVITPVFREEDDFENYAFVIVPLKNTSDKSLQQ